MASEKITNILEEIKTLTILELADLVKAVEEEFGVSATTPTGAAADTPNSSSTALTRSASSRMVRVLISSRMLVIFSDAIVRYLQNK